MAAVCNPLSIITGEMCPYYRLCKKHCVLARERGREANHALPPLGPSLENKVILVIGGGPAGLAAAWALNKRDARVTLVEQSSKLGGCLNLIPHVRLDKKHVESVAEQFRANVYVQTDMPIDHGQIEELASHYDHVIIATGAHKPRKLGIDGEARAFYALDYLQRGQPADHEVIIIGGGNVAMDCALHAIELGGNATVCYRKSETDMKAEPAEVEYAKKSGVRFQFNMVPKEITSAAAVFLHDGKEITIPCGQIVIAAGQLPDLPPDLPGYKNVHVIGDADTGPASILQAVTNAKQLAYTIM